MPAGTRTRTEAEAGAELDVLMARLAQGDRHAFDPLFRALHPRALRVAHARLAPASAADAAQSALLKVFTRAHEFTPGRPVLPWFYAVLANEVRAARRSERRHDDLDDAGLVSGQATDDALLEQELQRVLKQAIEALDASSAQAIAALLGQQAPPLLSAPTFRKRLSRAYARLRLLLGDYR